MHQLSEHSARRQFERKAVKANAFVHRHGAFQRAKIVDYSRGGLQLAQTFGLFKRDPIQVELISGLRVAGLVAWSLGGRTGVVFPEFLPEDHPVMMQLARKSAATFTKSVPH